MSDLNSVVLVGRLVRDPALDPMTQRRNKGLLHRFLGAVEGAAQPDQAGDDPAVLAAKNGFDRGANVNRLRHRSAARS